MVVVVEEEDNVTTVVCLGVWFVLHRFEWGATTVTSRDDHSPS
jgi:hypothetical protein